MNDKPKSKQRFSSSVAGRRIICPGSGPSEAIAPAAPSTSFADEGTALHAIMEEVVADYIENDKTPCFSDWAGIEHTSVDRDHGEPRTTKVTITEEMIEHGLEVAWRQFLQFEKDFGVLDAEEVFLETKCPYPGLPGQATLIDFTCQTADFNIILDWKFGRGYDVDPNYNPQMSYNANASRDHLYKKNGKPFVVVIIQPFTDPDQPKIWKPRDRDLALFHQLLMFAYRNAHSDKPRFAPSSECGYCTANGTTCPMIGMMQKRLVKLTGDPAKVAKRLEEQLALNPLVRKAIATSTAAAHERLERGMPVNGYKLVAKQANRAFVDERKVEGWGRRQGLVKKDMVTEKFCSPAQMETALKANHKAVSAKRDAAAAKGSVSAANLKLPLLEIPEKYVETPFTGTTIAPVDSNKPEVRPRTLRAADLAKKLEARTKGAPEDG